jgi:alpha-mannosidase
MKLLRCILLFAALSCVARAESNVEKVARTLDSLSLVSFNNWKASPDLKSYKPDGDPAKPDFDDSKWTNLTLNASIYPDSCWLRKTITVPKTYLGQTIGGSLRFLVSVDDYGYLWVNGESKGHFPWDGDFELTKNASAGQKFTIAIKAINTGGPLRLIRAELRLEKVSDLLRTIQDFGLSLRVGEKLLSFDTYQTNARKKEDPGTDKSSMNRDEKGRLNKLLQDAAGRLDVDALSRGDMPKFMSSLSSTRAELKPVRAFAKSFTLYFDANAHIDAAWLWRDKETIEVCKNTFSSVFNMMDARPEFTYTQSAAAYYDWMERLYPEVFKGIQKRVADGRWGIVGGMWVEPDCNLPGGISPASPLREELFP